ncbi:hypothetical protein GGI25_006502, partial [Coemansia spiralis]
MDYTDASPLPIFQFFETAVPDSMPIVTKAMLFDRKSGKLKKKAPNPYMVYRLQLVPHFKGHGYSAEGINKVLSELWKGLNVRGKNAYKLQSRNIQAYLDKENNQVGPLSNFWQLMMTKPSTAAKKEMFKKDLCVPKNTCIPVLYDRHMVPFGDYAVEYEIDGECFNIMFPVWPQDTIYH